MCVRGVPPKYVPRVEAYLKELEAQGYLPNWDGMTEVEKQQQSPTSGEPEDLPPLEEIVLEPKPQVPAKPGADDSGT